ncbi:MAG TPA: hypothetical protein VLO07_06080, partial [Thermoanaerobaculia bacterium]|nr:hypothetical protein [Thermoanaerobaculia bacterium]
MTRPKGRGLVLSGLLGVALFSLVFSLLDSSGHWPRLPPGALHDSDLVAGLVGGVAVLLLLFFRR